VLFWTPEYAGTLPGCLKNLLDWTADGSDLYGKSVGCQKSACPVTCDDRSQPDGIMVIRVPVPALSHLRPALRLDNPA
jgi:NADPH-dependent FMN reductase